MIAAVSKGPYQEVQAPAQDHTKNVFVLGGYLYLYGRYIGISNIDMGDSPNRRLLISDQDNCQWSSSVGLVITPNRPITERPISPISFDFSLCV